MSSNEYPGKGRRRRWQGIALLVLMVSTLTEAAYIFRTPLEGMWSRATSHPSIASKPAKSIEKKTFYCPMHPQYRSDKPGKCPDCGMDLVPIPEDAGKPTAAAEKKILYWMDPMHPQYKSDKPGTAPDCGMDLVPVYAESPESKSVSAEGEQEPPAGAFRIAPEKQQLIGVQYGEVTLQPLTKTIRAVARLAYDESRIVHVHSRTDGWIERIYINFTGQLVRKNQPLLSIYSPELVATQEEYLLALRARARLGESSIKEVAGGANSLLDAARRRLELWNVTDAAISELEKTGKPLKAVTLYSPNLGFVLARNAYENQRVTPDTELYTIADLSTIWAIADIYEYEMHDVRLGQPVTLTLSSAPGRSIRGRINYIYPQLDATSRTLKVRAEFANPDYALKPDMYGDVELRIDYGRRLTVPQEAVLDSGSEQLVFVARDGGYLEPRKVQLGDKVNNRVIVLSGLKAGEKVVTSGNFLVESESRLKSAVSGMGMPGMSRGGGAENQPQKQSGQAAPQALSMPSMDHSKHQSDRKAPKKG